MHARFARQAADAGWHPGSARPHDTIKVAKNIIIKTFGYENTHKCSFAQKEHTHPIKSKKQYIIILPFPYSRAGGRPAPAW